MMWEDVLKLAVGNGLWAVLSCVLLAYLVKDSRRREQRYTETIGALTERLRIVNGIQEDSKKILDLVSTLPGQKHPRVQRDLCTQNMQLCDKQSAVAEAGSV